MGEILQIQVGQCGNRIGSNFWKIISDEHGLNEEGQFAGYSANTQLDRINVYYDEITSAEGSCAVYVPRVVMVDTDSTTWNLISGGGSGGRSTVFRRENFVGGHGGTCSNWARGYYAAGGMASRAMNAIRLAAEKCDSLQGFQMVHSLGGGTGSGLGARVLEDVRREYPNRTVNTVSVVPSPEVQSAVDGNAFALEPYNVALSMARLISRSDNTYIADNRSLFHACAGPLGMAAPAYADLNHLVSHTVSGVTAGLRFADCEPNTDMKKCTANLVPYRRLHFYVPSFVPCTFRGQTDACAHTVPELADHLFATVQRCATSRRPAIMAASLTFRGRHLQGPGAVHKAVGAAAAAHGCWFVKAAGCGVPSRGVHTSGTIVANTTAVADLFNRVNRQYASMLAKNAFLHLFTDEGMTADEFRDARESIDNLIAEYRTVEDDQNHEERTTSHEDVDSNRK